MVGPAEQGYEDSGASASAGPDLATYGVSEGRKRLDALLGVPTAGRARVAKAKVAPRPKPKPKSKPKAQAGHIEGQLAAIANSGLDEASTNGIMIDLDCEGIALDNLADWKLVTLVNALHTDDFGGKDEWVVAYCDFVLNGKQQTLPARCSRREIILRMAACSLGF